MRCWMPWMRMPAKPFSTSSPRICNTPASFTLAGPTPTAISSRAFCTWSRIPRCAGCARPRRRSPPDYRGHGAVRRVKLGRRGVRRLRHQEALLEIASRQRHGQKKSLHLVAAAPAEPLQLNPALDALGRDRDVEALAQRQDRVRDRRIARRTIQIVNKILVDLDAIGRESGDI